MQEAVLTMDRWMERNNMADEALRIFDELPYSKRKQRRRRTTNSVDLRREIATNCWEDACADKSLDISRFCASLHFHGHYFTRPNHSLDDCSIGPVSEVRRHLNRRMSL